MKKNKAIRQSRNKAILFKGNTMSKTRIMPVFTGVLLACCVGLQSAASADAGAQQPSPLATRAADLAANFATPPPSAKTGVFWFWINGNITREGITADLESMARVGIKTVLLFETCGEIPEGPVKFLSAEWRALFSHALEESARLGMTLNMNNDAGWCGSGGPWNTPEHSMQKLVSTRTIVEGGKPFDAVLEQPPAKG